MARDRSLQFDIEAVDRAGRAFESVALRLDKLSARLDRLDRKRVDVDVDVNTKGALAHLDEFEGVAGRVGVSSGQGFTAGFSAVTSDPRVLGAAVAVGLSTLPAAAELAGGATALAFGIGLSGIGAIVTAKTFAGEQALEQFKRRAGDILLQTAKPFESTFNSILASGEHSLAGLSGFLHRFFRTTGPDTRAFFDHLGEGVDELGPSVDAAADAFNGLLRVIGPKLPGLFRQIDDSLVDLFATVNENPQTFVDLGGYILQAAKDTTDLLSGLTRIANFFDTNPIGKTAVRTLFGSAELHAVGDLYDFITDKQGRVLLSSKGVADGFTVEAQRAKVLDRALEGLKGGVLGVEDAHNQFLDSLRQASSVLGTNGDSLNRNTQKGRANREALSQAAHAALEYVDAVRQQFGPGKRANRVYEESRDRLVKLATRFGLTKKQADRYVTAILGIPKVRKTTVHFRSAAAMRNLRQYARAIAGLPSDVTTHGKPPGDIGSLLNPTPGTKHHRAGGGPVTRGRSYIVGEHGPELFTPVQSGRITPNDDLTGPKEVVIPIYIGDEVVRVVRATIQAGAGESKSRVLAGAGAVR